ncbi:MAG: replication/maintenance protein RepL [Selenomonadaceae bacterium]|nr:replication/maintenance protein RepL [Selenomonadaceae bacterium]
MKHANGTRILEPERWVKLDKEGNPTDEVAEFDVVDKPVLRQNFMIAYLSTIVSMIDKLGNQKMQVVKYLLKEMDSNNLIIKTIVEIEKETSISDKTIRETLKILENANIIHRRTGVIMISPKLVNRGNAGKERYLLTKFHQID